MAEQVKKRVEERWHNDAVPAAVGTAGHSWKALASCTRWAIIIFPFAYVIFCGTILAYVGAYDLQTRIALFLASDCGKLHQIVFLFMWVMIFFILTASVSIIFTWDHVLWVKVVFPAGSLLLVIIGIASWVYEGSGCQEYFVEHCMGVWSIFQTSTVILALLTCLAWYNALSKAPFMLPPADGDYEPISDKDQQNPEKDA
mmetsp:Transcript_54570/g.127579  ORF Transcript_54570/g.127579 Transcript_54570/m.127579 type:complete len:200 (+) Transcript_54570:151-750(+)